MTLSEYIKLDDVSKNNILLEKGILLDVDTENDKIVNLFALYDFFVEVTICNKESKILDVTPYKRGFWYELSQKAKQKSKVDLLNYFFLT